MLRTPSTKPMIRPNFRPMIVNPSANSAPMISAGPGIDAGLSSEEGGSEHSSDMRWMRKEIAAAFQPAISVAALAGRKSPRRFALVDCAIKDLGVITPPPILLETRAKRVSWDDARSQRFRQRLMGKLF